MKTLGRVMSRTSHARPYRPSKLRRWSLSYEGVRAPADVRASEALVDDLAETPIDRIEIDDGGDFRLPEFIGKEATECLDCGFVSNVPALVAAHDFGHTEDT